MARPIEYGLVLKGQDAVEFDEYCKNPTFTEKGIKTMRRALKLFEEKS